MGTVSRYLDDRAIQSSDASTYRADLPHNTKISAVDVRIELTNGATSGTQQIADALTAVRVMDGAYPIHDVFPRTELAIHALISKQRAPQVRDENAAAVQQLFFTIYFGRYLGDEDYYLDTAEWNNPQLRLPYAPSISSTTFATGTFTVSTRLHYWDKNLPPAAKGYMRWVEGFQRTSLASGDTSGIYLPTDKPLLGVMIYSREAAIAVQTDWVRTRILDNIAGDEVRNLRTEDLFAGNHREFGLEAIERGNALRQDNGTIDTDTDFLQAFALNVLLTQTTSTDILVYTHKSVVGDRITLSGLKIADSAGTVGTAALDTTNRQLKWQSEGRGLPHAGYINLCEGWDPDTRYQFDPKATIPIILTDGGADADQHITPLQLGSRAGVNLAA